MATFDFSVSLRSDGEGFVSKVASIQRERASLHKKKVDILVSNGFQAGDVPVPTVELPCTSYSTKDARLDVFPYANALKSVPSLNKPQMSLQPVLKDGKPVLDEKGLPQMSLQPVLDEKGQPRLACEGLDVTFTSPDPKGRYSAKLAHMSLEEVISLLKDEAAVQVNTRAGDSWGVEADAKLGVPSRWRALSDDKATNYQIKACKGLSIRRVFTVYFQSEEGRAWLASYTGHTCADKPAPNEKT